jgi:polyhydroxyalkanoate synthase subunit PhaC
MSPYHNFVKQAHPVNIRHLNNLIECVSVDDKTHGLSRFFARQILDALSPSNYLATNLEAMQRAMETGGDGLIRELAGRPGEKADVDDRREGV